MAERARIQGAPEDGITLDSAGGLIAMDRVRLSRTDFINVWTLGGAENPTDQAHVFANGARLRTDGTIDINVGNCGGDGGAGRSEIVARKMSMLSEASATLDAWSMTDPASSTSAMRSCS